jgi:DNA repair exonuclease SbcCD ATPase subunit
MQSLFTNISWADIGGLLLGLAAIITSIIGGIKSKADKKAALAKVAKDLAEAEQFKYEGSAAQAAAVKAYAEAAALMEEAKRKVDEHNAKLQEKIDGLECKVDELLRVIKLKDSHIQQQQSEIKSLRAELAQLRGQLAGDCKKLSE